MPEIYDWAAAALEEWRLLRVGGFASVGAGEEEVEGLVPLWGGAPLRASTHHLTLERVGSDGVRLTIGRANAK